MDLSRTAPDPAIVSACQMLGWTPLEAWTRYFSVGGSLSSDDMAGYFAGASPISDLDHDVVALVLNEEFADRAEHRRVPYWQPPTAG